MLRARLNALCSPMHREIVSYKYSQAKNYKI